MDGIVLCVPCEQDLCALHQSPPPVIVLPPRLCFLKPVFVFCLFAFFRRISLAMDPSPSSKAAATSSSSVKTSRKRPREKDSLNQDGDVSLDLGKAKRGPIVFIPIAGASGSFCKGPGENICALVAAAMGERCIMLPAVQRLYDDSGKGGDAAFPKVLRGANGKCVWAHVLLLSCFWGGGANS
jgi:hypothetical protein